MQYWKSREQSEHRAIKLKLKEKNWAHYIATCLSDVFVNIGKASGTMLELETCSPSSKREADEESSRDT